jgi:tetracycline 7-halogenase / FADH2 O2-dependent halogenase
MTSDRFDFDVAIVGSGFAGSLAALALRRLGRSVVLIERGAHPRFAIGESSSPLANLLLEELCERHSLDRIRPLAAWGSWRRTYPEVACGLKRGFTFYAHGFGKAFARDAERRDQLLVAASPCDEVADTHWYRADFDAFLAAEAEREGAVHLDRTRIASVDAGAGAARLELERGGATRTLRASLVVDASGPGGALARALGVPVGPFDGYPRTEALYTHFDGVARCDASPGFSTPGDPSPPYPADDAALHHVFPGGWIWVLRFSNGIVSAGVAAESGLARELRLDEGAPAWERLLGRLPSVREQFAGSRDVLPFVHRSRLSYRASRAAGPGWILLPSAAAFVDPLLSTGFPLALLGIARLARVVEESWGRPDLTARLDELGRTTLAEADAAARLTAALYASFADFPSFALLTRLYFAAASWTETCRRLGRPERAQGFLLHDDPAFGPALRRVCDGARSPDPRVRRDAAEGVRAAIDAFDVVGLNDESRRNWYPVDARDLIAARHKLGAREDEILEMLERTGSAASSRR